MNAIVKVAIPYSAVNDLKNHSDYSQIREEFPDFNLPEDPSEAPSWIPYAVITEAEFWRLVELGLKPEAHSVRGLVHRSLPNEITGKPIEPEHPTTAIYNISVPNASLLAIQKVTYLEDACTDKLQRYLESGWRIVAVCPPNDTRRPTYIIGHFDPNARI